MTEEEFLSTQSAEQKLFGLSNEQLTMLKQSLPDKKYYEFLCHCFYEDIDDVESYWNEWQDWKIWDYPVHDVLRFDTIITHNKDLIDNAKCVSVSCHLGYMPLFLHHAGATEVQSIDTDTDKLTLIDSVARLAGYNNHKYVIEDIQNTENFKELCNTYDLLLLVGKVYNPASFYNVLNLLKDGTLKSIIIDTDLDIRLQQNAIGTVPFVDLIEQKLNWKLLKTGEYKMYDSGDTFDRFVYSFVKAS